ncbi:MAG: hypothetical protein P4L87_10165 [Formivibrio sp.]|nr:hypothetical protein [Formivibrio sp.]
MARTWTDEQKARQAALIHSWKPWAKSTGPRTTAGKAASSKNVVVGQKRKQLAIKEATQELHAAQAKLWALTKTRKAWWERL